MCIDSDKIWESLTITNNFIFVKAMKNKSLCKKMLEILLEVKIGDIKYLENEKTISERYKSKGIRLDVYVEDEDTIYDIEMQVADNKDLAKRSRYYQSLIDLYTLEKGESYRKLKKSYIIFLCTFDPFKENMPKYEFRNYCKEKKELELKDEVVKLFFNAKAFEKEKSKNIKAFLQYVTGEKTNNNFVEELEREINEIKENNEWRKEYMTLYMRELEIREESLEEGIQLGIQQGREEGILKGTIDTLKSINFSEQEIITKVSNQFNIPEREIKKYL